MREILFRGKRTDNGAWVEGAFCLKDCDNPFGDMVDRPSIIKYDPPCDGFWFRVDPETVGQFTGLTDKNGKKIFEGDIARAKIESGNHEGFTWPDMSVGFQEGSFCLNDRNGYVFCVLGAFAPSVTLEIIGNIHDNPELLEG